MLLHLDEADGRPLYEQIAAAVRKAVADGRLRPGDRLPSGRDLAESSGVTLETVQRAYRLLVADGLVTSRVGRGTTVAADVDPAALSLVSDVDELVRAARALDLDETELVGLVRERWSRT